MNIRIPGKTFLVGEYSVLLGGPALGLATQPTFDFQIIKSKPVSTSSTTETSQLVSSVLLPFKVHCESPAGMYVRQHADFFSSCNLQNDFFVFDEVIFSNSYLQQGVVGGFGQSTAEYLLVWYIKNNQSPKKENFLFADIRKEYRDLHVNKTMKPSGIDLAFQYYGHVCLAKPDEEIYQNMIWPFANLDFYIISTGLKVPTHQHLSDLNKNQLESLPQLSNEVIQTFLKKDQSAFLEMMDRWVKSLQEKNLTHPHSIEIIKNLESVPSIELAKPCGALGADVIIVFFLQSQKQRVREILQKMKLNIIAEVGDLCKGFKDELG